MWIRDFSYSYNEPMTKRYYSHPAFGNYPVVGVNWKQATAFCVWRTQYLNAHLEGKHMATESSFTTTYRVGMGICSPRRSLPVDVSLG